MSPPEHNPITSQLPEPDTNLEYVERHSETGIQEDSLRQQELQLESDFMMSDLSSPSQMEPQSHPGTTSSTQEFLLPNKKKIWNVKSSFSQRNSPNIKSYETSVRELIGQDPDLEPFFDTVWMDQYEKSWFPTEIDSPDWALSFSSSLLKRQEESSWFWIKTRQSQELTNSILNLNWERTSSQSFTFSHVDTMGDVGIERPKKRMKKSETLNSKGMVMRVRRVRIKPTLEQMVILKDCMGIYRHIYNECVKAENNGLIYGSSVSECSRWRTILTKKQNYYNLGKHWKDKCPSLTKQQAVEEFFKNKKTGVKMVCDKKLNKFKISFKSRFKCRQETIPFERFAIRRDSNGRRMVSLKYNGKDLDLSVMSKFPKELLGRNDDKFIRKEIKISRTRLGKYYAYIPMEIEQVPKFPGDNMGDMVSFDPGSKTFLTYHSPDGNWGEIGKFEKQESLLKSADRLKSKLDREGKHKDSRWRRRIRRRILGVYEKVRNRTSDLHNKISSWAVNTYRIILLPVFESSSMVSSGKLFSSSCRKMMTWSHYKFQRKLVDLAQKYTDVKVRLCNEAFTTKQCGKCGTVNQDMTLGDRVFNCSGCRLSCSRDGHAARNIGLRSLKYIL